MLNVLLVPLVRPELLAVRLYPEPLLSMVKSLNVAIPFTAARVSVPVRIPFPAFVPIANTMSAVLPETRVPVVSRISAVTAGFIIAPATVLDGCCKNLTEAGVCGHTMLVLSLLSDE
jgi:hypothetical protein